MEEAEESVVGTASCKERGFCSVDAGTAGAWAAAETTNPAPVGAVPSPTKATATAMSADITWLRKLKNPLELKQDEGFMLEAVGTGGKQGHDN